MLTVTPPSGAIVADQLFFGLVYRGFTDLIIPWQGDDYPYWNLRPLEPLFDDHRMSGVDPFNQAVIQETHLYFRKGSLIARIVIRLASTDDVSIWTIEEITYRDRMGKPPMKTFTPTPGGWRLTKSDDPPQIAVAV